MNTYTETMTCRRLAAELGDRLDGILHARRGPRNCDLYAIWFDAHRAWEALPKDEMGCFVDERGTRLCEMAWLFAPAGTRGKAAEGGAE